MANKSLEIIFDGEPITKSICKTTGETIIVATPASGGGGGGNGGGDGGGDSV